VSNGFLEKKPYRFIRKLIIATLGMSVLLVGAAMLFLPGPAIVVIPAGLAILATEFAWARALLRKLKEKTGWKTSTS
jgi:tellurite resistance protein TerC